MKESPSATTPFPGPPWPAAEALEASLASPQAELRAFWRMRRRLVHTIFWQTVFRARFRLVLILVLSALLWMALYWLFADGFAFLGSLISVANYDSTVSGIFGLFYLSLLVMLVLSSALLLYGSLFHAPDVALLFTLPSRVERVFLYKLQEAILLSSWAFMLLGSPMLVAYGVVGHAPWYYMALLVPYLVAFTYIPAGIGAIFCLLLVRFLPRGWRLLWWLLAAAVATLLLTAGLWLVPAGRNDLLTPHWFQTMLGRLSATEMPLLPSWWLSDGLLSAARENWSDAVMFLVLLVANALAVRQAALILADRVYRAAYSRLQSRGPSRRRAKAVWTDRAATWLLAGVSAPMRLLMLKDFRLFRRDPVQWTQFLIFVGLLFLYFVNIRRLRYDQYYVVWVNMVSFLNIAVVGLLLSTFTTRFIFPMMSLEGRRFWVLGLVGVRRETILWSKVAFAIGGSIVPCSLLILLSDKMLGVEGMIVASHQLTCVILCCGLSGIAVGLGAKMPNLREESPSKIAAGFGGTLNLVISTLFILAVVLLTALPSHFYLGYEHSEAGEFMGAYLRMGAWLRFWLLAGTAGSVLLGVAAMVVPLKVGVQAFRQMEF
jgi:ABC-2 type transport system permease protein